MSLTRLEESTGKLFGNLFSPYDDDAFRRSVEIFAQRFKQNNFDLSWFSGKSCLDAGCGGGRYSIALTQLGAKNVIGLDISMEGVADAKKRASAMQCTNLEFKQGSVEKIPAKDNEFDCIINSGVLMHTKNPVSVIKELARVLKSGGMLYGLVYATEGVRWPLVQILRPIANLIGFDKMDQASMQAGMPVNKRRTYLDDLFVPYIDFYTWQCLEGILAEAGFDHISRWNSGRLDHEEDINSYVRDLTGFLEIFSAAKDLLKKENSSLYEFSEQAQAICNQAVSYLDFVANQVESGAIDSETSRNLTIGQGHHRFIAWKK